MKKAGVKYVCVGYESPIDEDLKAMRKGYLSSNMVEWTKVLRRYFWVHGMFIVGYPLKENQNLFSSREIVKRYKKFIKEARIDTIQVMLPVPLVGTDLRKRIQDKIFPLSLVPWTMYDGNHPCFKPDNISVKELQQTHIKLMKGFYQKVSLVKIGIRTIAFPFDFFLRGWSRWLRSWQRSVINYSGHLLVKKWLKRKKKKEFFQKLHE